MWFDCVEGVFDNAKTDFFRSPLVDVEEQGSLQTVSIEVTLFLLAFGILLKVVDPSNFAVDERKLEFLLFDDVLFIYFDAFEGMKNGLWHKLGGNFEYVLVWPCPLAEQPQMKGNR